MKYSEEEEKKLPFSTHPGACTSIRVNVLDKLTLERRIVALERLRELVKTERLDGYDDTTTGDKNNECSWGMCRQDKKLWPDAQDYIWPYETDRVAPLGGAPCPMDAERKLGDRMGCFHRCRFFQKKRYGGRPTREEVIEIIDEMISKLSKKRSKA